MMTQEHHANPLVAHLARVSADLSDIATSLQRDRHGMTNKLDAHTRAFVQGKLSATQDSQRRVARAAELAEYEIDRLTREREDANEESLQLQAQIEQLGAFIMATIPGEPSQSQGAVDTAIRIIGNEHQQRVQAEQMLSEANGIIERLQRSHDVMERKLTSETPRTSMELAHDVAVAGAAQAVADEAAADLEEHESSLLD